MPNPSHTDSVIAVDLGCPEYGGTAEVFGRDGWESTERPIEQVRMLYAAVPGHGRGRGTHTRTAQCQGTGAHSPWGR